MSRRMPIAPMMLPSVSRRADALSVVGIISPDALRGCSRTLRVTSRSTTSRPGARSDLPRLVGREKPGDGLLEPLVPPQAQQTRDRIVGLEDLAFQVTDEDRIGRVRDDDVGGERRSGRALRSGYEGFRHVSV